MTDNTQPAAGSTHIIRYALEMGLLWIDGDGRDKVREALDALDTLEAQLEAIGAGGVSALMGAAKAGSDGVASLPLPGAQEAMSERPTITVDAEALRQVLQAFGGPPHLIGELRAIARLPADTPELNPVGYLVKQYNDWTEQ